MSGGLWSDARRRLRGNRAACLALALLALVTLAAFIVPALSPWAYDMSPFAPMTPVQLVFTVLKTAAAKYALGLPPLDSTWKLSVVKPVANTSNTMLET